MKEYKNYLKNMFQFNGRSRRREYWVVSFINASISILLYVIMFLACTIAGDPLVYVMDSGYGGGFTTTGSLVGTIFAIPLALWSLFIMISTMGLTVRRFHDVGIPGWVYPICILGCCCCGIGAIVMLVIILLPSKEDNQYGVNPKSPENDQYKGITSIIASIAIWVVLLILFIISVFANVFVCGLKPDPNSTYSNFGKAIEVDAEEYAGVTGQDKDAYVIWAQK